MQEELMSHDKPIVSEADISREETMIRRVAWTGGVAVTTVTLALLVPLLMTASHSWQYPIYAALGGVPLGYALFCSLVIFRVQVTQLNRHQAQLLMRVSELKEMASHDEMTGLYNRRHFYEVADAELARAQSR